MNNNNRFISLLSDYGFKIAFADESDTLFLRRALQALIQSEHPITTIQFSRNEFPGLTQEARGGVFDLICTDEKNRTFIVEMQLGPYKHFMQRSKFYAFHRFNTLVAKGNFKFDHLPPIYCIGLVAKGIFPHSNHYYHFGRLSNQEGEVMDDQIIHIIIEIDKFSKKAHQIQSDLDKLIYIMKHLKNIQDMDRAPKFLSEEWIMHAMKKLDKTKMTPEQRMHYEMTMAKNASTLHMREEALREAMEEGLEKGLEAGLEKGRQEGHQEGLQQGHETALKTTAKKMKALGISPGIIHQATGLSLETIEQL